MQTLEELTMSIITEKKQSDLPELDKENKAKPKPLKVEGEVKEVKTNSPATKEDKEPCEKTLGEQKMPTLKFDDIYNKIINEENIPDVEDQTFDTETGDFETGSEETTTDELEADLEAPMGDEEVATQIQSIYSALQALAMNLGIDLESSEEAVEGDEFGTEEGGEETFEGDEFGTDEIKTESAKAGCYGKLKPNGNKGESLKKGQNTTGKLHSAKKGKAPLPAQKGDKTGKIQQISRPATKEVSKSAGTVKGNSPAVKGKGADFIQ